MLMRRTAASAYEPAEWIDKLVAYTGHLVRECPTVKVFGVCISLYLHVPDVTKP
jgi:hypothetical protein